MANLLVKLTHMVLGTGAAVSASVGVAGPPVSLPTLPGGERSFGTANDGVASARSGGLVNEWRFRKEWHSLPMSYGSALRFARCVARMNPSAATRMLNTEVAAPSTRSNLVRLAAQNRGCIPENGAVPPILLRAAFAELMISDPKMARVTHAVGLPRVIEGFNLAALASCQLRTAPQTATMVYRTLPGSQAEQLAAEELFNVTPGCATGGLGRISPTVVRLALVEAALAKQ
jgi:hypothetical protein